MDEAVRRWLAVQRELGGDEVFFDRPLPPRAVRPAVAATTGRSTPPLDGAAGRPAVKAATPAPADAAAGGWRKGAPPIPGPGFVIGSAADLAQASPAGDTLERIVTEVAECRRCQLCETRTHTVPGEGNPQAGLMVVGEGPGESEDRLGRPFVGRAGELLDKMLLAIELPRAEVFIANVVKCRPPRNRTPLPDERLACLPYLRRQIALVRPRVLLALGTTAAEALLDSRRPLGELRLKVHRYNGVPLVVTYHPAALLRNPNWKRPAWDDLRIARQLLDVD